MMCILSSNSFGTTSLYGNDGTTATANGNGTNGGVMSDGASSPDSHSSVGSPASSTSSDSEPEQQSVLNTNAQSSIETNAVTPTASNVSALNNTSSEQSSENENSKIWRRILVKNEDTSEEKPINWRVQYLSPSGERFETYPQLMEYIQKNDIDTKDIDFLHSQRSIVPYTFCNMKANIIDLRRRKNRKKSRDSRRSSGSIDRRPSSEVEVEDEPPQKMEAPEHRLASVPEVVENSESNPSKVTPQNDPERLSGNEPVLTTANNDSMDTSTNCVVKEALKDINATTKDIETITDADCEKDKSEEQDSSKSASGTEDTSSKSLSEDSSTSPTTATNTTPVPNTPSSMIVSPPVPGDSNAGPSPDTSDDDITLNPKSTALLSISSSEKRSSSSSSQIHSAAKKQTKIVNYFNSNNSSNNGTSKNSGGKSTTTDSSKKTVTEAKKLVNSTIKNYFDKKLKSASKNVQNEASVSTTTLGSDGEQESSKESSQTGSESESGASEASAGGGSKTQPETVSKTVFQSDDDPEIEIISCTTNGKQNHRSSTPNRDLLEVPQEEFKPSPRKTRSRSRNNVIDETEECEDEIATCTDLSSDSSSPSSSDDDDSEAETDSLHLRLDDDEESDDVTMMDEYYDDNEDEEDDEVALNTSFLSSFLNKIENDEKYNCHIPMVDIFERTPLSSFICYGCSNAYTSQDLFTVDFKCQTFDIVCKNCSWWTLRRMASKEASYEF